MAWRPSYCTAAELRTFVRVPDAVDDAQLSLAAAAASRAIDRHCLRQFGKTDAPATRVYGAPEPFLLGGRSVWAIDDLMSDTGLAVTFQGGAVADVLLWPYNAPADGRPWTHLLLPRAYPAVDDRLEVAADVWGWTAVPDAVKEAALLQGSRLDFRRDAPAGVAGSPESGSEIRLLARLDPDVAVSLGDYRRRTVVG